MRSAAALLALVLLVPLGALAEGAPAREAAGDARPTLRDAVEDARGEPGAALREARALVRELRHDARALVHDAMAPQAPVEIRANLLQAGLAGQDETVSVLWVGAGGEAWRGAYWIESAQGSTTPGLLSLDATGALFFLDAGRLALQGEVDATYRFLGADGSLVSHRVRDVPLLAAAPDTGRIEIAGAHATEAGDHHPAALLLTLWNLHDDATVMGVTTYAGARALETYAAGGCEDPATPASEPGCRPLFVLHFDPGLTHVEAWREDAQGRRVVERSLARDALLAGHLFAG